MFIIIGLGNPGESYAKNRHNVGFMFVDWLAGQQPAPVPFSYDKYSDADITKIVPSSNLQLPTSILAKPQTYMNRSGFTANKLISNLQLPFSNLIVAHDDLDITLGEFKIQKGKGPKVHNGLSSIESSLRFKDFWRIRIGIDNRDPQQRIPGEPYVLQNFTSEERTVIESTFSKIFQKLQTMFEAQEQS